jgi:response regulator RpfG family c-di-GMP phosphodiesterase
VLLETRKEPCILIVDDQDANVRLLEQMLGRAGYHNCLSTLDSREVLRMWEQQQPDIILLDLHMPHLDGFGVMEQLKAHLPEAAYLPILVLTADSLPATKKRALSSGATDFLAKPFDAVEVILRIRNLLETRFLHVALQHENQSLGQKVVEKTHDLEEAQIEMLERLAVASESRDDNTGEHTQRVGRLAAALGLRTSWPEDKLDQIRRAAALHDIGKIAIPDRILLKPGKLTPEEFEIMKTHAELGARTLAGSRFPIVQLAEQIARYHHEKWDGSGYYGLAGAAIPLAARIVALADVFDVLTHVRPYKHAWTVEDALARIEQDSGSHFDPQLVPPFLQLAGSSGIVALGTALEGEQGSEHGEEAVGELATSVDVGQDAILQRLGKPPAGG